MQMLNIQTRNDLKLLLPEKAWVAEIGVAEGHFSADMLGWGLDRLYMVDIWQTYGKSGDNAFPQQWHDKNYQGAKDRVAQYERKAIILKGFSCEMARYVPDFSLDMVYLDGGHDYASVMADLVVWRDKVKIGGVIAGHDFLSTEYGVFNAANDYYNTMGFEKGKLFTIPDIDVSHAGFWFRNTFVENKYE